jgi:4-hydroxy-3-methylbut-2-enyl diphosphate reductase
VIGGYNSSNTAHLAELAEGKVPAYHIDGEAAIVSREAIRHKPVGRKETVESSGWLPDGPLTIGVTAGASTPDVTIGAVVTRVHALRGLDPVALEGAGAPAPAP